MSSSLGGYAPEELIYTSGAVPIALVRGGDRRPVDAASSTMWPVSKDEVERDVLSTSSYRFARVSTIKELQTSLHWIYELE